MSKQNFKFFAISFIILKICLEITHYAPPFANKG
nr:MAG TPA: protein of unknown function (DUF4514) [Caudoviricetes sp.]DAP68021.1 MAG TPA: protein of unknown function (DUF4514) [Caudoviricetes sp.]